LILLDVTMPELNGFEALRRIRAGASRIPVLLASG
jgi:CheY-like chemotaxis protein